MTRTARHVELLSLFVNNSRFKFWGACDCGTLIVAYISLEDDITLLMEAINLGFQGLGWTHNCPGAGAPEVWAEHKRIPTEVENQSTAELNSSSPR